METFDPVKYSLEENNFFLTHLGESPVVALGDELPAHVSPAVVQEVLGEVYSREEIKQHRGTAWIGIEAVVQAAKTYLDETEKWRLLSSKKGAPRFPSLYAWDGRGRPHRGGIGSDSAQVTTYLLEDGKRQRFAVELDGDEITAFTPTWIKKEEPLPEDCTVNMEQGIITCPVDGWSTNFNAESRSAFNLARARVARHCRHSKDVRVQEFGRKVFG